MSIIPRKFIVIFIIAILFTLWILITHFFIVHMVGTPTILEYVLCAILGITSLSAIALTGVMLYFFSLYMFIKMKSKGR